MRGTKTSAIDPAKKIVRILIKNGIGEQHMSYGIIIPVRGRRDHRIRVKCKENSGALLLQLTGKRYKQELRIYGVSRCEDVKKILRESLGEQYDFIENY